MSYRENKLAAITHNNEPSLTDQAAARDTDINVIVAQFTVHGQAPGTTAQPLYEDFTNLPTDLRGFIELGREMEQRRNELPEAFRTMSIDELMTLTPADIQRTLTPAQPDTPKPEDTK